jgi:hypothetical protein
METRTRRALLALAAGLAGLFICGCPGGRPGERPIRFTERPVDVRGYYLFDAGIADADGDGHLDIFTSNHTARPSLLAGDGRGNFRDVYAEWGLSQQPEFPGLEDSWTAPEINEEGIFIFRLRRRLIIKASLPARAFDISGRLIVDSSLAIVESSGWECALEASSPASHRTRSELVFRLVRGRPEGTLVLDLEFPEVPQAFAFEKTVPLSSIFIGAQKTHPREHAFNLSLKDRHGLAWADWNGDGRPDVFIASGGVSGRIADFPEIRAYELFLRSGAGLVDATSGTDLIGNGGRPRQPAWLDVDGDNVLELFIYGIWSRSQLFKLAPGGTFIDVTEKAGLLSTANGLSAWFDADGDIDPDLLVSAKDEFVLYLNDGGAFREVRLGPNPHALSGAPPEYRQFGRPAFSDFDGDGDIDIYVASANGSTLILNLGGAFRLEEPGLFGLPSRAVTAAWVDADNDSLPDLYSVPDGLFRQSEGHRFNRTGILAGGPDEAVAARCLWFDADNDGDRDVLISVLPRESEAERLWSSRFLNNEGSGHHWLEVQVVGPPGNRDAIGARVVVELGDGRRLTDYVGLSEGSYYSQGHYRLYFGLGKTGRPKSVSVLWPDGAADRIEDPTSDRLMVCGRGLSRRDSGGPEAGRLR